MVKKKLKRINTWLHLLWISFLFFQCTDNQSTTYTYSVNQFKLYPIDSLDWVDSLLLESIKVDTNFSLPFQGSILNSFNSIDSLIKVGYIRPHNTHHFSFYASDSLIAYYVLSTKNELLFTYFSNGEEPDDYTYYSNGIARYFKIGNGSLEPLNNYDARTFTEADYYNFSKFGTYSIDSSMNQN